MPSAFANERILHSAGEIPAGGDEEGATSHRRIGNAEAQDAVGVPSGDERVQCLPHEEAGDRARRVERATRLAAIARADERRAAVAGRRLVIEELLVDRAKLLDVEIAIGDAGS